MAGTLYVIVGAGASYDSTSDENLGGDPDVLSPYLQGPRSLRPPLVTQLFEPRFAPTLNRYPIAQIAASDIRRKPNDPVAIEDFLRTQYRDSDHELDRRKFHAIHYYLQDLLWTVSKGYTTHPDNYDRLSSACLRLPSVVFITLNYDTLLDDRLRLIAGPDGFTSMTSYIEPGRNWSLVKLHGSVDWGIRIQQTEDWSSRGKKLIAEPPANIATDGDIELRGKAATSLDEIRLQNFGAQYYYPALSVPLGSPDVFSCPNEHVEHLRKSFATEDDLNVLMLGYSALDDEVLSLLAESGKPLGTVGAVNQDAPAAEAALGRVIARNGEPRNPWIAGDPFSRFVSTDDLHKFIHALDRT